MAYVTEQMIFDHFAECDKKQTLDDLQDRFDNVRLDDLLKTVYALVTKRLLDEVANDHAWALSDRAKKLIQEDLEKTKQELEHKELELRKTKTDLALAEKMLKEYPYTKWTARLGFIIAIGLAVLELIKFLKGQG